MKWIIWNDDHWILQAADGEVIEEIRKTLESLYVLKSNNKKYTTLKAAQEAGKKFLLTKPS